MTNTIGQEITIKKTANTDMTPDAYTVYAGTIKIAGNVTAKEAREIAQDLTRPAAEAYAEIMEMTF
jgi:hypothetical protein